MADSTITAAATAGGVKAWKKALYETPNQTKANATDIGWLRNNDSRLNLVSELTPEDKQQVYKVKALTEANLSMAVQSDHELRVQIHDAFNNLIADSKTGQGKASQNFEDMRSSAFKLKTGTYYVTVKRAEGVAANADVRYAMQMRQGDKYTNDYVTTQVKMSQSQRAQLATNPAANMPAGIQTYNSAGTLIGDAMSSRSSMFGGVDFGGSGNILGVKTNA
jgi:hypothetical protein